MAAFFHLNPILLGLMLLTSMSISPSLSFTCTSQTFTGGKTQFKNCTDLPVLNAFLHYSYDPTNSTLSIAFIAPPPKPEGWVSWAINPKATGMVGSQAFIAYKDSNGSVLVKTFDISSYGSIVESSKLSFDVLEKRAEFINGSITIFATVVLPKSTTSINQVWQVGPAVKGGVPEKHAMEPENMGAKGVLVLDLTKESVAAPTLAPTEGGADGKKNGGGRCGYDWLILVSVMIFPLFWSIALCDFLKGL